MLLDAAALGEVNEIDADVCIIGAGPAGLTVAHGLDGSRLRVLVLECGSSSPPTGGADVAGTRNVGLPYPLRRSRAAGVGGSSLRWDIVTPLGQPFVRLRELDPLDFEARPAVELSGWPFAKEELLQHYRRAWEVFGLPPADPAEDHVVSGELEQHVFSFGPAATFTERVPAALRTSTTTTVLTDVAVRELRTDGSDRAVSSLAATTSAGARVVVRAQVYVLASGGIENARLLLSSRSRDVGGLANSSDLVGRCFMEHPHYAAGILLPRARDLERPRTQWDLVADDGRAVQRKYALSAQTQRAEGLLNAATFLARRSASRPVVLRDGTLDHEAMRSVNALRMALLSRRLPPDLAAHLRRSLKSLPALARYAGHQLLAQTDRVPSSGGPLYTVAVMAEQEPSRSSRVRLTDDRLSDGTPVALLDWRTTALDEASMLRTQTLVGPVLGELFGGAVQSLLSSAEPPHLGVGYHHMGTTRMSASSSGGVVDPDCRAHDVRNLFVAGSSVFPTGGCANPTLTIVALSLRLASLLRRELQPGAVMLSTPLGTAAEGAAPPLD